MRLRKYYFFAALATMTLYSKAVLAEQQIYTEAPLPPTGMAQIIFFRPSNPMGMTFSCNVREGGKMLGTVNNGRYFILNTVPGLHRFTVKSGSSDVVNIEAEADETSYIKCKIAVFANLSPSTKEEFTSNAARMKPSDPAKMAHVIAEDDAKRAVSLQH